MQPEQQDNDVTRFKAAAMREQVNQVNEEWKDTLVVAKQMKDGLTKTLEQIDKAFRSTMLMYQVSFYLGVALVIVATVAAFALKNPLLPAVFGSLGTLDVLAFFLKNPQEKLQCSRADLAQLQAALYNWFMDSVSQRTVIASIWENLPVGAEAVELYEKVAGILLTNTEKTLDLIQKYCEPKERA
jgi:hypothetical protein